MRSTALVVLLSLALSAPLVVMGCDRPNPTLASDSDGGVSTDPGAGDPDLGIGGDPPPSEPPGSPPGCTPPGGTPPAPPPPPPPGAPPAPPPPTFSCTPPEENTTNGGGTCGDLHQAWTARGINVGYYPYRVKAPLAQYSGDYSGAPNAIFTPGAAARGVILQVLPAGAYVGVATTGPWYDPPTGCFTDGDTCGNSSRAACGDNAPPRRPNTAGFVWAYGYSGASHMQGWIRFDPAYLEFAGFDANHPCALGPAGADFEASSCNGKPMACKGDNRTCGGANKCDEGSDDCGSTTCGASTGGVLTPDAHHMTATRPGGHACTTKDPPNDSVKCLANGSESDFFFVYPFGAYVYWAQNSTTKFWLHYGDKVQVYYHTRDAQDVLWDFIEVTTSTAPVLTPPSDGSGAPDTPCKKGGACGWIQDVFLQ
jgi:hypothetical protein